MTFLVPKSSTFKPLLPYLDIIAKTVVTILVTSVVIIAVATMYFAGYSIIQ